MTSFFFEQSFLTVGIFLVLGYTISLSLQKIGIPHVVSYLLTGFILTNSVMQGIGEAEEFLFWFHHVENLALGLIGFKIGTELKIRLFKKNPRQIFLLLIGEVTGAFAFVFIFTYIFALDFTLSLILAGLATATAPAATVEMLRKLKAKGPLTQWLQWILAFDDVVAVLVVEGIIVYVGLTLGVAESSFVNFISGFVLEVGLSILLGLVIGFLLDTVIERMKDELEMMELTTAAIVLSIGIASYLHTSVILTCIMVGATSTNMRGDNYEKAGDLLEILMTPIIMIFFVFVGATVHFYDFEPFPWLALVYLIARSLGKISGAFGISKYEKLPETITNNLGFGLLAQGGVALGLVTLISDMYIESGNIEFAHTIVTIIVISTIFSEILGSYGTRFAVIKAGEQNAMVSEQQAEVHIREVHQHP